MLSKLAKGVYIGVVVFFVLDGWFLATGSVEVKISRTYWFLNGAWMLYFWQVLGRALGDLKSLKACGDKATEPQPPAA